MIERRTLLGGSLAALVAPKAGAQAPRRIPTVGFIGFASAAGDRRTLEAFREGLRVAGHQIGETILVEAHSMDGDIPRGLAMIDTLAARPIDVFLSPGPAVTRSILARTSIPVVAIGLPSVASGGMFGSLSRPGGTVTGFSNFGEELSAKRIEILREAMPHVRRIGVLHNDSDPNFAAWGEQTIADAKRQGLSATRLALSEPDPASLRMRLAEFRAAGGEALVVIRDFLTSSIQAEISANGLASGIAVIGEHSDFAAAGALLSYGPDIPDLFRRAAGYVDRIIRGERAGVLPIQLPTKLEFAVNLRTARALGLTLPPSILLRADEVIE